MPNVGGRQRAQLLIAVANLPKRDLALEDPAQPSHALVQHPASAGKRNAVHKMLPSIPPNSEGSRSWCCAENKREYFETVECPPQAAKAFAIDVGYSAGVVAAACLGGVLTLPFSISSSIQSLWCSFAQLRSTVPSHMASKAPSMPMVPI